MCYRFLVVLLYHLSLVALRVNQENWLNYHLHLLNIPPLYLSILFTLMYGVLHMPYLVVVLCILSYLLMILLFLHGFIFSIIRVIFFSFFFLNFSLLPPVNFNPPLKHFILIGEVGFKICICILTKMAFFIVYRVLILMNKMVFLREKYDILLIWV